LQSGLLPSIDYILPDNITNTVITKNIDDPSEVIHLGHISFQTGQTKESIKFKFFCIVFLNIKYLYISKTYYKILLVYQEIDKKL